MPAGFCSRADGRRRRQPDRPALCDPSAGLQRLAGIPEPVGLHRRAAGHDEEPHPFFASTRKPSKPSRIGGAASRPAYGRAICSRPLNRTSPNTVNWSRPSPWSFTWRTGTAARWASLQPCGYCTGRLTSKPTPAAAMAWQRTAKQTRPGGYWRGSPRAICRGVASGRGTYGGRGVGRLGRSKAGSGRA